MTERTARVALLAITLLFVLWGLLYIYRTSTLVGGTRLFLLWDDGMISMRYARNLAEGHGLTWNPDGERVQGISNLGLTLAMALIHLLPVDLWRTSLVFQLLSLGLATRRPRLDRRSRAALPTVAAGRLLAAGGG